MDVSDDGPRLCKGADCEWRILALQLKEEVATMAGQVEVMSAPLEALKRQVFGKKSEKIPPLEREVKKLRPRDKGAEQAQRRANAELRDARVESTDEPFKVPEDKRQCDHCFKRLRPIGEGKISEEWNYVAGFFRRRRIIRETLGCSCGQTMVTADGPARSVEGTKYGDGFRAFIVTSKCADAMPLYRLAKHFVRMGIPIPRSTLTDLFHQTARELEPLYERLLQLVASAELVQADETPMKVQNLNKKGYVWTFLADNLIAYKFSVGRGGQTPAQVLGNSQGTLVVDLYTGYNTVTGPEQRTRAACLAHVRRKFFDAMAYLPEARFALDLIRDIYVVEHDAKIADCLGTREHLLMRQARSGPILARLRTWIAEQTEIHPPKSPLGTAMSYVVNNWIPLTRFLDDPKIPPDNNRSESALRIVALGRKNFLFFGNEEAGHNIAGLYSLVATCEANGVNPIAYLTDVLARVRSHPASDLDALLPQNWNP